VVKRVVHADEKGLDVTRQDIWGMLQAAAKPELRRVFAAMNSRPCWLDTGEEPGSLGLSTSRMCGWRSAGECVCFSGHG
jgi:hypothetical protein